MENTNTNIIEATENTVNEAVIDETTEATSVTEEVAAEATSTPSFFQQHKSVIIKGAIGVGAIAAGALLVRHFVKKHVTIEVVTEPAPAQTAPTTGSAVQDMPQVGPQGESETVVIEAEENTAPNA